MRNRETEDVEYKEKTKGFYLGVQRNGSCGRLRQRFIEQVEVVRVNGVDVERRRFHHDVIFGYLLVVVMWMVMLVRRLMCLLLSLLLRL